MKIKFILFSLILSSLDLVSQPTFIFNGGIGIGQCLTISVDSSNLLSQGGNGSGDGLAEIGSNNTYLNLGGANDGHSVLINYSNSTYLSTGGSNDGHTTQLNLSSNEFLTSGGINDGYSTSQNKDYFIWTGSIGTGWNVSGNWNHNEIPNIDRPVIIPEGVPNWPHVNTGLFSIMDNPNNGSFLCGSLWIQENAMLVTRTNNRIENYGQIKIDGEMRVKNSVVDAFQNIGIGQIIISSTGTLTILP